MKFRWLRDPEAYDHPRLAWLAAYAFDLVLKLFFRVEHDLSPQFCPPRGCLLVSRHLRDSDGPLIGQALFRHRGLHVRCRLPFFALREDVYEHEGLANLACRCPRALIGLLRRIPLQWVFNNVRTYPLRRIREFTWHDTLRELTRQGFGGADPMDVFNDRGRRELRQAMTRLPGRVDAIDAWRMGPLRVQRWGLRRLSPMMLHRIAPGFRRTVTHQLRFFAAKLDAGHAVYLAPEGCVSRDGRFGRIRAGIWRLGRMTRQPMPIQPFSVSYDSLAPGRTRVVLRHGVAIEDIDFMDTRALSARLQQEFAAHRVITASHLLAFFLTVRDTPFGLHELAAWLGEAVGDARSRGFALDPLFDRVVPETLVDVRLRWLARKRLVAPEQGRWRRHWSPAVTPGWTDPGGIVRYLANDLADFAPELVAAWAGRT